jgi:hypothetical protein
VNHYFAVLDDHHDVKDPLTVVRVSEHGSVRQLTDDAAWATTRLLERIEAGEVPYRLRPITEKAAARIRERREKKVAYRYSVIVRNDDPNEKPVGVLREYDASDGSGMYGETYTRDGEWTHSNVREDIERASGGGSPK